MAAYSSSKDYEESKIVYEYALIVIAGLGWDWGRSGIRIWLEAH